MFEVHNEIGCEEVCPCDRTIHNLGNDMGCRGRRDDLGEYGEWGGHLAYIDSLSRTCMAPGRPAHGGNQAQLG